MVEEILADGKVDDALDADALENISRTDSRALQDRGAEQRPALPREPNSANGTPIAQ